MQQQWTHREEKIRLADGLTLHHESWQPEQFDAVMVLVHGAFEHVGRYRHVVEHYAGKGVAVFAHDHRGHGRSEGRRAHVDRFAQYLEDLQQLVARARQVAGDRPVIMLGHSMGGLVALSYALERPQDLTGLVITSPWLGIHEQFSKPLAAAASVLSRVAPRLALANGTGPAVCRDAAIAKATGEDPLMIRTATPRWFTEIRRQHGRVAATLPTLRVPTFFLQAGTDSMISAAATQLAYEQAGVADKAFKLYPDMYHEILNDSEKEQVFADIDAWLHQHGWLKA